MQSCFPKAFIGLILLVFLSQASHSGVPTDDRDWELSDETNGIRVYTRDLDHSSIKAFRAEVVLDGSLESVMAIMSEPGSCVEWVHQCAESYGLPDGEFNERYAYSVNDMPWPVNDRDYVLRIETESEAGGDRIIMNMEAVEDMKPEQNGYIRINTSYTIYEFERADDGRTRMTWYQHAEPGGSIPNWLVNRLLTDLPVKSLEKLNELLQQDSYQDHELVFDDDDQITDVIPPDPDDNPASVEAREAGQEQQE